MNAEHNEHDRWTLRMKDLCEASGHSRQTIHFYIRKGLLPPGHKTDRNQAVYGPIHLDRLALIAKLQHERFLPLDAIKALLDDQHERFSTSQRRFLSELRGRLETPEVPAASGAIDGDALVAQGLIDAEDLADLLNEGLIAGRFTKDGRAEIAAEDAWLPELFGQLRAAGLSRELGFEAADLRIYDEAVTDLLGREGELIADRMGTCPEAAAALIQQAMPLIHTLILRYHAARIRDLLDAMTP